MRTMKTNNNQSNSNQEKALDAFCANIHGSLELAAKLEAFLQDHMRVEHPDQVNWAQVGDARRIHEALKELATTFNLI